MSHIDRTVFLLLIAVMTGCTAVTNATVSVATLPVKMASAVATETIKTGGNIIKQTVNSSGDIAKQAVDSGGDVAGQMVETAMEKGMKAAKDHAGNMIDDTLGLPDGTGKAAMTIIDLIR